MSITPNPKNHLTSEQEKEAVLMYLLGETQYTKIAEKLKVPYQAVNTYMTRWKKANGILKTRKTRSDKKVKEPSKRAEELLSEYRLTLTQGLKQELEFLRDYYLRHVKDELKKNSVDRMRLIK